MSRKNKLRKITIAEANLMLPRQEVGDGRYILLSFPEDGVSYVVIWNGVAMPYATIDGEREYLLPSEILKVRELTGEARHVQR